MITANGQPDPGDRVDGKELHLPMHPQIRAAIQPATVDLRMRNWLSDAAMLAIPTALTINRPGFRQAMKLRTPRFERNVLFSSHRYCGPGARWMPHPDSPPSACRGLDRGAGCQGRRPARSLKDTIVTLYSSELATSRKKFLAGLCVQAGMLMIRAFRQRLGSYSMSNRP